ncbi:hypothetical protein AJ80_05340 [Polytolypa hystricis UAMH7299]|uniref:NAD(P)-binding domain-containing protein n=1 Tax=Polytolypa hystricis (strain UAMH7299) TaxID=1447883 RepID=A0A2B7Y5R8_POLH7|nr:hypothetical protein AJ80_05340 [Polytolypa hystricis UAMH7299]
MASKSVFLVGPGFIGGEALHLLLQENYQVTTLVRSEGSAASLHKLGVKTVKGTLDDKPIIQKQVEASDIVFNTASSDHLPSVEAILDGIKARANSGKPPTIYIHTSGASLIGDDSEGAYKSDVIYDDKKPEMIDALPDTAAHRKVDLAIVNTLPVLGAKAKLAIIIPPLVYGVSIRDNRLSIQLPTIVRHSLKHGYAGQIGQGRSVWNQIHVKDLARGYMALLHWLERTPAEEVAASRPYFFCENGEELSWGECAAEIGKILVKEGRLESPTPKTIPEEHYGDLFAEFSGLNLGSNSRSRANRLRDIGWQPKEKRTIQSLVEDEIPLILKETGPFHGYAGLFHGYAVPVASGENKQK